MKKLLILISLVFGTVSNAQKGASEASVDVANGIIMKSLGLGYEYYILDRSSVGLTMLFNFANHTSSFRYNERTMITPYFRHYFTKNDNWNYFGEVFFGINSGYKEEPKKDHTDMALGAGGGLKYISDGGIVFTAYGGVGRNMFNKDSYIIVPRAGLSVGYRF